MLFDVICRLICLYSFVMSLLERTILDLQQLLKKMARVHTDKEEKIYAKTKLLSFILAVILH